MKKTINQIRTEIEKLIDTLNLDKFKEDLLKGVQFNYRLKSFADEDYSQLGNSRLGGLPDLPKEIDYPYKEEGYYNLLCQINFAEFENKLGKLPESGILYLFDGHSSEEDHIVFFTKTIDNLEKKFPPKGMKNLNEEYRESHYEGLKVQFEIEHYFSRNVLWEIYTSDKEKHDALMKKRSQYQSHILGPSMSIVSHVYKYLKGFDTLVDDSILFREIRDDYESQMNSFFKECEEGLKSSDNEIKEYFTIKKRQLIKIDKEKEEHFKNYQKVTCLIGLESLDRLGWMWSDSGFKYVYILDEDLEKGNLENLLVETWSS